MVSRLSSRVRNLKDQTCGVKASTSRYYPGIRSPSGDNLREPHLLMHNRGGFSGNSPKSSVREARECGNEGRAPWSQSIIRLQLVPLLISGPEAVASENSRQRVARKYSFCGDACAVCMQDFNELSYLLTTVAGHRRRLCRLLTCSDPRKLLHLRNARLKMMGPKAD